MYIPVQILSSGLVLNEWKGGHCHYPIGDCHWRGRTGKDHCGFGGYFTTRHVSLVLGSYRDGSQRDGKSADQIRETPPGLMSCESADKALA